jgi:hypothetical protein
VTRPILHAAGALSWPSPVLGQHVRTTHAKILCPMCRARIISAPGFPERPRAQAAGPFGRLTHAGVGVMWVMSPWYGAKKGGTWAPTTPTPGDQLGRRDAEPSGGHLSVIPAHQLGSQCVTTPARKGRIVLDVLLVCLGDQCCNPLADTLNFFLHVAIALSFVPRRIALEFGPIGRPIPQLHQTRLARNTKYLNQHVAKGRQMQLAKITDGAKIRSSARPTAAPPGFLFIGGTETVQVSRKHRIEHEKPQVRLRQLGLKTMGLMPVAFGVPEPIRFSMILAHHRSPRVGLTTASITKRGYYTLPLTNGNYRVFI